jgi:hypothetical protein
MLYCGYNTDRDPGHFMNLVETHNTFLIFKVPNSWVRLKNISQKLTLPGGKGVLTCLGLWV